MPDAVPYRMPPWRKLLVATSIWILAVMACDGLAQERRFRNPQARDGEHERRIALVIGNKAYPQSPLATAENDATDMAAALEGLGFRVILATNLDPTRFRTTIRRFEDELATADGRVIALVFYAGHGVQMQGKNYLLPARVEYRDQRDVIDFGIDADQLLSRVTSQEPDVTIMILDACRDSPLPPVARSSRGGAGLARMDPPAGTFLAFATSAGSTASDNPRERNGLFTKFVLKHIQTPGLTTEQVFRRVRTEVYRASRGQQLPEDSNRLVGGDFFFVAPNMESVASNRTGGPAAASAPAQEPAVIAAKSPAASVPKPDAALAPKKSAEPAMPPAPAKAPQREPSAAQLAAAMPASRETTKEAPMTDVMARLTEALDSGRNVTYQVVDRMTGLSSQRSMQLESASKNEFRFSDGSVISRSFDHVRLDWASFEPPIPLLKGPMEVGARWNYRGVATMHGSYAQGTVSSDFRIEGFEPFQTELGSVSVVKVRETRWVGQVSYVFEWWLEPVSRLLAKLSVTTPSGPLGVTGTAGSFAPPFLDMAWTLEKFDVE